MITPQQFIDEARKLVGSPYRHQGRAPGKGIDCTGVIAVSLKSCGVEFEDLLNYTRLPHGGALETELLKVANPVSRRDMKPGDILKLAIKGDSHHLAVYTERGKIIHAVTDGSDSPWINRVVEHRYDEYWAHYLRGVYRLKAYD